MPLYHSDGRCRPDLGMVHKAEVIEKTAPPAIEAGVRLTAGELRPPYPIQPPLALKQAMQRGRRTAVFFNESRAVWTSLR